MVEPTAGQADSAEQCAESDRLVAAANLTTSRTSTVSGSGFTRTWGSHEMTARHSGIGQGPLVDRAFIFITSSTTGGQKAH